MLDTTSSPRSRTTRLQPRRFTIAVGCMPLSGLMVWHCGPAELFDGLVEALDCSYRIHYAAPLLLANPCVDVTKLKLAILNRGDSKVRTIVRISDGGLRNAKVKH